MTLERHILNILQRVEVGSLLETTLEAELVVVLGARPGSMAVRAALKHLTELGWVEAGKDALTQDLTWKVTEAGKGK